MYIFWRDLSNANSAQQNSFHMRVGELRDITALNLRADSIQCRMQEIQVANERLGTIARDHALLPQNNFAITDPPSARQ